MKFNTNKKEKFNIRYRLFIIITILTIVTLVTGTSYAILKGSVTSEKEHIVRAGNVTLELTEYYDEINKDIYLYSDEDGLLQDTVYEFNIKNIGVIGAKYDVKLINQSTETNSLPEEYIRVGLEVNGIELGPMNLTDVNNIIDSGMISINEIISFKMRLWLDSTKKDEIKALEGYTALLKLKIEAEQRTNTLDTSGANEPVLSSNMIAVYYDSTCNNDIGCWKKADQDNVKADYQWYDYDNKMWANAVTVYEEHRNAYKKAAPGTEISMADINTMFVWIPRYKYKVWNYNLDGTVVTEPQEIEITFEKGLNSTGEITCTPNITGVMEDTSEICMINNTECTDSTCNGKTYTHPAFTFGDKGQTGIWIGKFEPSATSDTDCYNSPSKANCSLQNEVIKNLIIPNVKSRRYTVIGHFDRDIRSMNDNNNIYGFHAADDIHMMKNIEWAATAYLSHSKYGTCEDGTCAAVQMNSSSEYITGCGPQTDGSLEASTICNSYETELGKLASTTGNVYGVYDMSGGSHEWIMANVVSKDAKTMITGRTANANANYSGILYQTNAAADFLPYTGIFEYPNKKYYDIYNYNSGAGYYQDSYLGDAGKEIFKSYGYGWYDRRLYTVHYGYPWMTRGGSSASDSITGIFYQTNGSGGYGASYSARVVISK